MLKPLTTATIKML